MPPHCPHTHTYTFTHSHKKPPCPDASECQSHSVTDKGMSQLSSPHDLHIDEADLCFYSKASSPINTKEHTYTHRHTYRISIASNPRQKQSGKSATKNAFGSSECKGAHLENKQSSKLSYVVHLLSEGAYVTTKTIWCRICHKLMDYIPSSEV